MGESRFREGDVLRGDGVTGGPGPAVPVACDAAAGKLLYAEEEGVEGSGDDGEGSGPDVEDAGRDGDVGQRTVGR